MALIVEGIVTTMDARDQVNFAPMGVEWGADRLVLKPFLQTTTFRNLSVRGCAVFNLVDDVLLFAQAAIGSPQFPWRRAERVAGAVVEGACSWRELEVDVIDATPPRSRIDTRIVHHGRGSEFVGFNRAKHAVLEAAILSTRLHLLPPAQVGEELARLEALVEKTAGEREREAWALLRGYVAAHPASRATGA